MNFTNFTLGNNLSSGCPVYEKVYLEAYEAIKLQLGKYLIFFAATIIVLAVAYKLYKYEKITLKKFMWIVKLCIALELFWIFNLIGLYFLKV